MQAESNCSLWHKFLRVPFATNKVSINLHSLRWGWQHPQLTIIQPLTHKHLHVALQDHSLANNLVKWMTYTPVSICRHSKLIHFKNNDADKGIALGKCVGWLRDWHLSHTTGRENWGCSDWRRPGVVLISVSKYLVGRSEDGARLFSAMPSSRKRGSN